MAENFQSIFTKEVKNLIEQFLALDDDEEPFKELNRQAILDHIINGMEGFTPDEQLNKP